MSKKAIVTGGSRGIGHGIALGLAAAGYDVAISYNTKCVEAEDLAKEIKEKYGRECYCFQASLQEKGAGEKFLADAVESLGGLDLLVNNAGLSIFERVQDLTVENLDLLLGLNFRNYIIMMSGAVKYMIAHDIKGSIVNITSSRGERAYPSDGIYGGLKAGINRVIQSFALDVAPYGIRINNVAPGAIAVRSTEQSLKENNPRRIRFYENLGWRVPLERMGTPEDIANMVVYLASDKASYITGVTFRVDGGLILPGMPETIPEDMVPGDWTPFRNEKK